MFLRERKDVVGGSLLTIIGIAFTWYALIHYDLGTLSNMGPGMFPAALGVLLAIFGTAMAIVGLFERDGFPEIHLRQPVFVVGSVAAFALLLPPFGVLPAVLGVVIVSALADSRARPLSIALLGAALCLLAWLIFSVGLALPMPMLHWPF